MLVRNVTTVPRLRAGLECSPTSSYQGTIIICILFIFVYLSTLFMLVFIFLKGLNSKLVKKSPIPIYNAE